jgi:hypothetical protein
LSWSTTNGQCGERVRSKAGCYGVKRVIEKFWEILLDGKLVFVVKVGKWGRLDYANEPHGVLRIHGSWATPDALSGLGQSWIKVMRLENGGVV